MSLTFQRYGKPGLNAQRGQLCGRDIPPLQGSSFLGALTRGYGETVSKKRSPSLLHPGLVYAAPLGLVPVAVLAFALHLASSVTIWGKWYGCTLVRNRLHRWQTFS